jgi:hypothetical protein
VVDVWEVLVTEGPGRSDRLALGHPGPWLRAVLAVGGSDHRGSMPRTMPR